MKIMMLLAGILVLPRNTTSKRKKLRSQRPGLTSGSQKPNTLTMNPSPGVYMLLLDPRKMIESRSKKQELYSPRKNSRYSTQKSSPMVSPEPTIPINRIMRG